MNAKVKKKLMFISSNICAGCKGIFERRFFLLRYGFSRKDFSKMFIHRFLREMLSHFSAFDHFGLHFPLFWYVRFFDSDKWGFLIPFFIWTLMCDSNLWFTIPPPGNFTFFLSSKWNPDPLEMCMCEKTPCILKCQVKKSRGSDFEKMKKI